MLKMLYTKDKILEKILIYFLILIYLRLRSSSLWAVYLTPNIKLFILTRLTNLKDKKEEMSECKFVKFWTIISFDARGFIS